MGPPEAGSGLGPLLSRALNGALSLLRADRGNVQVFDPATGSLRIAAQHGFDAEFLDYFAVVTDDGSACGRRPGSAAARLGGSRAGSTAPRRVTFTVLAFN